MKKKSKTITIPREVMLSIVSQSVSIDRFHYISMLKRHVCGSCGASCRQMLLIKHREGCSLIIYHKAMDVVRATLTR